MFPLGDSRTHTPASGKSYRIMALGFAPQQLSVVREDDRRKAAENPLTARIAKETCQ
jgi:hypothetical protein